MKVPDKIPTDLDILEMIHHEYYHDFSRITDPNNKVFIPIDCKHIAKKLNVDPDVIFGRLYYHLEHKYSYKRKDNSNVSFFQAFYPDEPNRRINFPYMLSILASLQEENRRKNHTIIISILSLFIATISLISTILFRFI